MMLIHFLVSLVLVVSGVFSQAAANMASKGVTSQTTSGEGSALTTGTVAAGVVGGINAAATSSNFTGNHSLVFTQTYNVPAIKNASIPTGDTTSSAITTSWTPVTMVYTTVETFVYKPITRSEVVTVLSTLYTTIVTTKGYPSPSETVSYVAIISYSTESEYTTSWLAPPTEIDATETYTRTTTTEEIVVPTDVTYFFTSVPPSPAVTTRRAPLVKRSLAWRFVGGNITSFAPFSNTTASFTEELATVSTVRPVTTLTLDYIPATQSGSEVPDDNNTTPVGLVTVTENESLPLVTTILSPGTLVPPVVNTTSPVGNTCSVNAASSMNMGTSSVGTTSEDNVFSIQAVTTVSDATAGRSSSCLGLTTTIIVPKPFPTTVTLRDHTIIHTQNVTVTHSVTVTMSTGTAGPDATDTAAPGSTKGSGQSAAGGLRTSVLLNLILAVLIYIAIA